MAYTPGTIDEIREPTPHEVTMALFHRNDGANKNAQLSMLACE